MATDANTMREHAILSLHPDLEAVNEWLKATFTRERMCEAGVVAAALVLTGYLGATIYQGFQRYTIAGF
jgi:hypothetical protein